MLKLSTLKKIFKVVRVLGILILLAYFAGIGPSTFADKLLGGFNSRLTRQIAKENSAKAAQKSTAFSTSDEDEDLCLPMGERDRKALLSATGADVIRFLEQSTIDLHRAKSAEDQLKVVALNFDHSNWSKAWTGPPTDEVVQSDNVLLGARVDDLSLQANLSHATMVLARYNRLLENGRRQETSALDAFHWQEEVRQEIRREPVRILVQSFLPYTCTKSDANYYGCAIGEKIYRVKSLMSPRIACRFKDKRDQYAVIYWIRVKDQRPKILEVDAKGQRLVKGTYDELEHRKFLSALSPNIADVLHSAGLDPFRATAIWRQMNRKSVSPGTLPDISPSDLMRGPAASETKTESN